MDKQNVAYPSMEYYLALKYEILIYVITWMNLENTMLKKPVHKGHIYMIEFI